MTPVSDAPRPEIGAHRRFLLVMVALGILLAVAAIAGISAGSTPIPPDDVWRIILGHFWPDAVEGDWTVARERIVLELRAPRVVLGALAGAGLAMAGAALQAATNNPLAEPYLLGVSAGAALGAVAVIAHLGAFIGLYSLPVAAFAGGLVSLTLLILVLGRAGSAAPDRVILAGVAISFLLMAGTNLLIFLGDQRAAHSVVFWMLGGLGRARWDELWIPSLAVGLGGAWLMWRGRALNALMMGDESATAVGLNVIRLRLTILALTALMTSVLVALTGAIGFVGLVVPHILRSWLGGDNRRLIPAAALGGAGFLVLVDIAARLIVAPQEAPIGVITGGVGGAYFCWLMARRRTFGKS